MVAFERLGARLKAVSILLRLQRSWQNSEPSPKVTEDRRSLSTGVEYDLYEPRVVPAGNFIALHGLTVRGERDPRLVHFARSIAISGFRVVVPALPGLKRCSEDRGDVDAVISLVQAMRSELDRPVRIVGFSFGASVGLVAAADERIRSTVGPLLLFGAPYRVDEIWESAVRQRGDPHSEEDDLYIKLVLAHRDPEAYSLTEDECELLESLLASFCTDPVLERQRTFVDNVIVPREPAFYRPPCNSELTRFLSPAGNIVGIGADVLLLHDPDDSIVPPSHSQRIFEELATRQNAARQWLLITPIIAHVAKGSFRHALDVIKAVEMFARLFLEGAR